MIWPASGTNTMSAYLDKGTVTHEGIFHFIATGGTFAHCESAKTPTVNLQKCSPAR